MNLDRVRTKLVLDHPFFYPLLLSLRMVVDGCPTAWTDGKTLGYNPEWLGKWEEREQVFILCHEVMHIANLHQFRRGGRDKKLWNVACDYAINGVLVASGLTKPEDGLFEDEYVGWSAEQIYEKLKEDGGSGDGTEGGEDGGKEFPGDMGQVRDYPGDGQERRDAELETKAEVYAAAKLAEGQGKLPGPLRSFVDICLAPKVDWRHELRDFFKVFRDEPNWSRRNSRIRSVYMPCNRSRRLPPMAVAVDTSGSISDELLSAFKAELQGLIDDLDAQVTCYLCHAKLYSVRDFDKNNPVDFGEIRTGGTDFRPVFEEIEKGNRPAGLIFFTDLCGTFPEQEPDYPTLWLLADGYDQTQPPFGRLVKME
jgi:predicted metal-dependent peptidase